jgi:lysophospholipase L1-like esterase
MENQKITDLAEKLVAGNNSWMHFVDPDNTSQSAAGSSYKISKINYLKELTAEIIAISPFLGGALPTDTPTGSEQAYWVTAAPGTYTNYGGVIVNTNSFAVISRDSLGVYSISQTALDLTSYAKTTALQSKDLFIDNPSFFTDFGKIVKNISLIGTDPNKQYYLSRIAYRHQADNMLLIRISDATTKGVVSEFRVDSYTVSGGLELLTLTAKNGSLIGGKIQIDTSLIPVAYDTLIGNETLENRGLLNKKAYFSEQWEGQYRQSVQKLQIKGSDYVSNLGTLVSGGVAGSYLYNSKLSTSIQVLAGFTTYKYQYVTTGNYFARAVYLKNVASGNYLFRSILVTDENGFEVYKSNRKGDFTLYLYNGWTVEATCDAMYQGVVESGITENLAALNVSKSNFEAIKFYKKDSVLDTYVSSVFTFGSYYSISGTLIADANYYYQTNYTEVIPNKSIKYIGGIFQSRYIIFYDKNKNVVGSVKSFDASLDTEFIFTTPINCYYIRCSLEITQRDNFKIIYNDEVAYDTHSIAIQLADTATVYKNNYTGLGLASFLDRFRNTYAQNRRANICMIGDSLTAGTDKWSPVDTIYENFGKKVGYGGVGYIPCHPEQKGNQIDAIGFEQTGWQLRNQTQAISFNVGWFTKCGAIGVIGGGSLFIGVNQAYKNFPKYEFDTVKIYGFTAGSDASLRFRATDGSTFGAGVNGSGSWTTQSYTTVLSATPTVTVTTITGFGASTGRYVLEADASLINNSANVSIGAIELINSKGGLTVHRMAIGGYKASDHSTQYEVAQKSYFTNFAIDAFIINLGENDFATSDVDFLANMNIIISRAKTSRPNTPIYLTHWWSTVHDAKRALIIQLANDNGLQIIDTKEIFANWTYGYNNGLLNAPATVNDPHLNAKGSNYIGSMMSKILCIDAVNGSLQN